MKASISLPIVFLAAGWLACSGPVHSRNPAAARAQPASGQQPGIRPDDENTGRDAAGPIDLEKARRLLESGKFEKLLETFEPKQVDRLDGSTRSDLAEIFYRAALVLREKLKNVSFSSMYCERGLMLDPENQPLLRLQTRNYLDPEMKLYGGAEELAERLLALDATDPENQLLRGKAAFEQGEYDRAVTWLEKAARVGRDKRGRVIEEAWHLLELAKGKRDEIKSSLSMTRELEAMLTRARRRADRAARVAPAGVARPAAREAPEQAVNLAGGSVVLYMTSWCKYCQKAKAQLRSLNVKFEEKDIEKDESALMEMMRHAREAGVEVTGVPVLKIGNKIVVGYNPQRIEMLIDQIR